MMGNASQNPTEAVFVLEWLVVIHVLAAVIGLGPAYAFPFLLSDTRSYAEMERGLRYVTRLEMFPKVAGTIAVLSGIALVIFGSYGAFMQIWIAGSLAVYILIEIIVIGLLNPAAKKLHSAIAAPVAAHGEEPPADVAGLYARVRSLHLWASALSIVIFVLMVLKPH